MNRYLPNSFDYGMNGIATGASSATNGNDHESNTQSLFFASSQNRNEAGGYPIHETFALPQEPEYSQASRSLFFHDPRTGVATSSTGRVGGEYNGGIAAPNYMLQQPPAATRYIPSFHRRRASDYREGTTNVGSHCLGNNHTILEAARELCGSPFEDTTRSLFHQDSETSRHNYKFQEEEIQSETDPRVRLTNFQPAQSLPSPSKIPINDKKLAPENTRPQNGEDNELLIFTIAIPSLSLKPMTGKEVVDRVVEKADEVGSRYLPCVELLVACQQDLRAGLEKNGRRGLLTSQFFRNLLEPLPERFYCQNQHIMPREKLKTACDGIRDLLVEAKKVEKSGCEGMKNTFLGGMRDGESWGLRRWLSKNGGALHICNDLELILGALRKLPKAAHTTKLLSSKIGPKAKKAYDKLKIEVPNAYQEVSSAHPYLPFFHRLESALKGLYEFDPNDDNVICLDDSSDDDTVVEVGCRGDAINVYNSNNAQERGRIELSICEVKRGKERPKFERSGAESPLLFQGLVDAARKPSFDDDSDIEIVCVKNSDQNEERTDLFADNSVHNITSNSISQNFAHVNKKSVEQKNHSKVKDSLKLKHLAFGLRVNPSSNRQQSSVNTAAELVGNVEKIVQALETGVDIRPEAAQGCRDFWSNPLCNFVVILKLFQKLINEPASHSFLDPVNRNEYNRLIKNPLCFRDIVAALCNDDSCESYAINGAPIIRKTGVLECSGLKKWNMFEGSKLIQAVDLVFLNSLAFMGKSTDDPRKSVMKLRKYFWTQIRNRALGEKKNIPTKRKESSGFVIRLK